jgi:hypothetical protein
MQTVKLDKISLREVTGKKGKFLSIGIQVNGKTQWINGACPLDGECTLWKQGDSVNLEIYKDSWINKEGQTTEGWKFKLPTLTDKLTLKLEDLEKRIEKLENPHKLLGNPLPGDARKFEKEVIKAPLPEEPPFTDEDLPFN